MNTITIPANKLEQVGYIALPNHALDQHLVFRTVNKFHNNKQHVYLIVNADKEVVWLDDCEPFCFYYDSAMVQEPGQGLDVTYVEQEESKTSICEAYRENATIKMI